MLAITVTALIALVVGFCIGFKYAGYIVAHLIIEKGLSKVWMASEKRGGNASF